MVGELGAKLPEPEREIRVMEIAGRSRGDRGGIAGRSRVRREPKAPRSKAEREKAYAAVAR
jgi:hypothetical protein